MKHFKFFILFFLFISCTEEYTAPTLTPQEIETPKEPEKTLGFLVFVAPNTMQTTIYHIDTLHQIKSWRFLQGDFFDARIDCRQSMLYYFPKSIGEMQAIDIELKETRWTIPLTNSQSAQWFRGVDLIQSELYVADYNGNVNVYDHKKRTLKYFQTSDNYVATHFLYYDKLYYDRITYTFQQPLNNSQHKKIVNYNVGFATVCNMIFDSDLKKWFVQNQNEVLLFYNGGSGSGIDILCYLDVGISTIRTISGEKIVDVCRIAEDQFVVATDKSLYLYNHTDHSLLLMMEKENMMQLEWNNKTSLLAISSGKDIMVYSISQREIVQQYTLPYEIKKFFWYLGY